MGDDDGAGIFLVIGFIIGGFLGGLISSDITNNCWKDKLLKENHAEYNSKDGSFVLKKFISTE